MNNGEREMGESKEHITYKSQIFVRSVMKKVRLLAG
jgi:hypothetical protein